MIMKMIILFQLLTGLVDYDSTQVIVDTQTPIEYCELYYIEDDVRHQVLNLDWESSCVTVYLKQYRDYELIINHTTVVSLTLLAEEIVDDRDIDISSDKEYVLQGNRILFTNVTLTSKAND